MISDHKQNDLYEDIHFAEDSKAHLTWLLDGPVRDADGMLHAWMDGDSRSFIYEESTAYSLTLFCFLYENKGHPIFKSEAVRTAQALCNHLAGKPGCGKNGRVYLFDTAVCMRALCLFRQIFPEQKIRNLDPLIKNLDETAISLVKRRLAFEAGDSLNQTTHWSDHFNIHSIKALAQLLPWNDTEEFKKEIDDIIQAFLHDRFFDGIFYPDDQKNQAYLHPHCYALEGLLTLRKITGRSYGTVLNVSAKRLAEMQLHNGALPSYWRMNEPPTAASDTTAQAVRIWQILDAQKYSQPIKRGLDYLETQMAPCGGVKYSSRIKHANTWTTIFYLQATAWQFLPPDAAWMI